MKNNNKGISYICVPYTWNAEKSFEIANKVAADLMNKGYVVFSPVSHSHPVADYLDESLRYDQDFWMKQDLAILERCDEIHIVYIHNEDKSAITLIEESKGCQSECNKAKELNIPIKAYDYYGD